MEYQSTREMAYDIRDKIDKFIIKAIERENLIDFIKELLSIENNRKKIFRVKGYASTIEVVLGRDRMTLFKEVLKELNI